MCYWNVPGLFCDATQQCHALGGIGDPCGNSDAACQVGLFCSWATTPHSCQPATKGQGVECLSPQECAPPLACIYDTASNKNLCKPALSPGQACERDTDCASGVCAIVCLAGPGCVP
jgi:hypothetical protein